MFGEWSSWNKFAFSSDIAKKQLSFDYSSSKITTNSCSVHKAGNVVSVYITMITDGTVTANEKILTLPTGARPISKIATYIYNGAGQIGLTVDTNGEITTTGSISNAGWCNGILTFIVS